MDVSLNDIESRGSLLRAPAPATPLRIAATPPRGGKVFLSVVVPTYNERHNLPEMVRRLDAALKKLFVGVYELIVVDDDSPDRTWEIAQALTARYPRLRVVRRVGERGLSTAVIRGWQVATGDVLGVIDGDLQHPPEIVAGLWREIMQGADLAVGSRHTDGGGLGTWSRLRRVVSSGARLLGLLILASVVRRSSDPMSGCFLVRRSALAGKELHPLGYKILLEVLARGAVKKVREVGYVFEERRKGASKVSLRVYAEYVAHLVRLRFADAGTLRFLRFAAVGLGGVAVDMALLFLLSDPRTLNLDLTIGKVVAAEAAIIHNFLWNDALTFGDLARRQPEVSRKLSRLLRFNAICAVGLLLHVVLLHAQVSLLGMNRYVANALAIGLVSVWNYALSLRFGWGSPAPAAPEVRDSMQRAA